VTRNRKIDPEVLEREYIFDAATPPISFSGLAEKYGLARNTVAEKGVKGRWFERRKEFREQLGMKVTEALGDQWVRYETAVREKMMSGFVAYIEKWVAALDSGEIKVSTRDMLGIAAALRTFMADALAAKPTEEVLLNEDADLDPEHYRRAIDVLDRLEAGTGPDAGDVAAVAAAGAPGAGED
jgi:hypothetical protein